MSLIFDYPNEIVFESLSMSNFDPKTYFDFMFVEYYHDDPLPNLEDLFKKYNIDVNNRNEYFYTCINISDLDETYPDRHFVIFQIPNYEEQIKLSHYCDCGLHDGNHNKDIICMIDTCVETLYPKYSVLKDAKLAQKNGIMNQQGLDYEQKSHFMMALTISLVVTSIGALVFSYIL